LQKEGFILTALKLLPPFSEPYPSLEADENSEGSVEELTETSSCPICEEVIKEPKDKLPGDEAIYCEGLGFTVNVQKSQRNSMNLQVSLITHFIVCHVYNTF